MDGIIEYARPRVKEEYNTATTTLAIHVRICLQIEYAEVHIV